HTMGAFFDGAKNATTPNLTGKEGLLAGTALLFSTRFLLMAVGSALGGWAAAAFGYQVAFIINAASFLVSAYTVWLIPEDATRERSRHYAETVTTKSMIGIPENPIVDTADESSERPSFLTELREGLRYAWRNHFALTILIMNMIWATGGGSINIIFERIGGVRFARSESWNPDIAVAALWTATGLGLTLGMLIAHRTSIILDSRKWNHAFIGWTLILHGVLFSIAGVMPTLVLWAVFVFVSRAIVGVEYAVQETAFQRSLPDYIRGRISTLDRGAELTIFGLSSYAAAESMRIMTPETLTILSGILSALAGVVWFVRERRPK
ncbi:MAG: MFS transporter, partial [Acidobacteria bacterium]|nr:MFS transporter [Acidobacteriota bacterium]